MIILTLVNVKSIIYILRIYYFILLIIMLNFYCTFNLQSFYCPMTTLEDDCNTFPVLTWLIQPNPNILELDVGIDRKQMESGINDGFI